MKDWKDFLFGLYLLLGLGFLLYISILLTQFQYQITLLNLTIMIPIKNKKELLELFGIPQSPVLEIRQADKEEVNGCFKYSYYVVERMVHDDKVHCACSYFCVQSDLSGNLVDFYEINGQTFYLIEYDIN